jgi:hypothetical protein
MSVELLQSMIEKLGLAAVAEKIGYDKTTVCHVARRNYSGKPDRVLRAVEEKFSRQGVECPVLGDITLARCTEERGRPFIATNPTRTMLARTCPKCRSYAGDKP